jgi:vacuolar-type H+-ATPase subunit F/Vma7
MARIVAVAGPSLADGFRLAGVAAVTAASGVEVRDRLQELVLEADVGLVLVTEDLWAALDERARDRFESLARPIVLTVPAGAATDLATRRELIADMLRRAIGYRIQLGEARA